MKRKEIFHNDYIRLVEEDGKLIVVTKRPKEDVVVRSFKDDYKKLAGHMTAEKFFKKHDLVYRRLECPAVGGTLWMFTGNDDPSHRCELTNQDLEDLLHIVKEELKTKFIVVNFMKDVCSVDQESGFIFTSNVAIDFDTEDSLCFRSVVNTSDKGIRFEVYREKDPDNTSYDKLLDHMHRRYKVNTDKAMGLYGFSGDYAFITGFSWKKLPKNNEYYRS